MPSQKDRSHLTDRAHRLLDFLLAFRHPPVAAALAPLGFDDDELLHGWRLLRALGGEALLPFVPPTPPDAAGALEAWAGRWLPVIDASLAYAHPAVHARVLRSAQGRRSTGRRSTTRGGSAGPLRSVPGVIAQVRALAKTRGEARTARALLQKRGLDEAVLAEGEALVAAVQAPPPLPPAPFDDDARRAALRAAEDTAWRWYLQWSAIARAQLDDRAVLRLLGFAPRGRPRGSSKEPPPTADPASAASTSAASPAREGPAR